MRIVDVEQMRALEAAALAAGTSEASLQEAAGAAVAEETVRLLRPGELVVVLAGHGNNGRDGAVAARRLAQRGVPVDLFVGPRHAIRPEELADLRRRGVPVGRVDDHHALQASLRRARVAVDGLVGIGARGPLREPLASVAATLNAVARERPGRLQVVAVDIPSGIDADTGAVPGAAVRADCTVTLGAVKQGLLRFPAAERVGRLVPCDIGLPADAEAALPYGLLDPAAAAELVPPRPLDAHKYRFGRVLVVAGSEHFLGAPTLCVGGAARAGAGLVTLAAPAVARQAVAAHLPEATYARATLAVETEPDRAAAELEEPLRAASTLVVGPGVGRSDAATRFLRELLRLRARVARSEARAVVDADALFALGEWPSWWQEIGPGVVLTPHAGELARLDAGPAGGAGGGGETEWARAARLAQAWGCVLVAKGPFTSVARPDGRADVWGWANPALATGGTGDVLAGLCGGLLAQGLPPGDAARLAVAVHALAGQAVVQGRGWRTLLASDLLDEIPHQLAWLAARQGAGLQG